MLFVISACSFAPLTTTKTARSLGEGSWEIDTGFSPAYTLTAGRGISKNLDAGLIFESQISSLFALWGKYSLINSNEKISLALYGGLFQSADILSSSGAFIGPIISYKSSWFETYLIANYNHVNWNIGNITDGYVDDLFFSFVDWEGVSLNYLQYIWGVNFWFTKGLGLNMNVQYWYFLNHKNVAPAFLPGIELMLRF